MIFQYSIKTILLLTTIIAVASAMLGNPSSLVAIQIDVLFFGLILLAGWLAYFYQNEKRAFQTGFCVCLVGNFLATEEFFIPPRNHLCAYPASLVPDVEDWESYTTILIGVVAFFCSLVGAEITRISYVQRKHAILDIPIKFWQWVLALLFWMLVMAVSIHFGSRLFATVCQFLTTTIFFVSITCIALNGAKQKRFWISFAVSLLVFWIAWPFSYYLGPATYLYAFYRGDDAAWAIGYSMFAWFLAINVGLLVEKSSRWFRRTAIAELQQS